MYFEFKSFHFLCKIILDLQVEQTLKKANSARFAIRMVAKFFSKKELNDIISACHYSILYFNADLWLIPILSITQTKMLAASAPVLRISTRQYVMTK